MPKSFYICNPLRKKERLFFEKCELKINIKKVKITLDRY
jgi:hypothetical protein